MKLDDSYGPGSHQQNRIMGRLRKLTVMTMIYDQRERNQQIKNQQNDCTKSITQEKNCEPNKYRTKQMPESN